MTSIDWRLSANCYGTDQGVFYGDAEADGYTWPKPAVAKKICGNCPVAGECLAWALATREPWGIWGGLTPAERAKLLPPLGATA